MEVATVLQTVLSISGHKYSISDEPVAVLPPSSLPQAYVPATGVEWPHNQFTGDDLSQICSRFEASDDVWTRDFLKIVFLATSDGEIVDHESFPHESIITQLHSVIIPEGPLVFQPVTGNVYTTSRLFEDPNIAFVAGVAKASQHESSYEWQMTREIAVPSRLYYKKTKDTPLAGLRFAVKDSIDITGLETGCGSRAYRSLAQPQKVTAPFVQRLVDAGAVLVGKLTLTQFCDGQDPLERIDYPSPFNPRGEGYQKPSSSSSGSAVASASYPWLDFTIGTDTGGSVRHPAGVNGVYGFRPSLGTVKTSGLIVSPLFDTPGTFCRSAEIQHIVSEVMRDPQITTIDGPISNPGFRLIYPIRSAGGTNDDPPKWFPRPGEATGNGSADLIFEKFVRELETFIGTERQIINLNDLWRDTSGDPENKTLEQATAKIYPTIVYYTQHRALEPFISQYRTENAGRSPFIENLLRRRLEHGAQITESEFESAVQSMKQFSMWVRDTLFATSNANEIPLLVFPQSWGIPKYRDAQNDRGSGLFWNGFSIYSISYCSGYPDITVPVGQVAYRSEISGQEEYLPVSLSFLTTPNHENNLLLLLRSLEQSGILTPVETGSLTFKRT